MPSAPMRRPMPGQLVRSWVSLVDLVMVAPQCGVAVLAWEAGAASAAATSAAATIGVSFMGFGPLGMSGCREGGRPPARSLPRV
jgi:hypothetical protein